MFIKKCSIISLCKGKELQLMICFLAQQVNREDDSCIIDLISVFHVNLNDN